MLKFAKRFHLPIGVACLAGLAFYATANPDKVAGAFRIAVVDVEAAVKGYDRYNVEIENLKKEFQPQIDAIKVEEQALVKRRDDIDGDTSLSPLDAQAAKAEVDADYKKLQGRGTLLNEQLQRAKLEVRAEIVDDLNIEIGKIANEEDLHLVLRIDTDAVLYSSTTLDITPKLIDRLNQAYKKKH